MHTTAYTDSCMTDIKPKLLRVMTHDISLDALVEGQLRYLSENGFEVVGVAADTGRMEGIARREGVRCVDLPMHREISPMADLRSLWRMIRLIHRERPDIVHANTPKGSLLALVASWLCRVPVRIYYVTGLRFETATGAMRTLLKTMERITCRCATEVIPEGDGVARTLRAEGITRRPLRKVHNGQIRGINLEYLNPGQVKVERTTQPGVTTFIFIGRIVGDKGISELAWAFDRLYRDTGGNVRLLLVGDYEDALDPVDDSARRLLRENPAVTFAGLQSDIRPWLAASDVLVLPSYREGFPNVVLEAGAMGLPVVVTDVNGADEVITEGYNGLIVPRRDADALYKAMSRMHSEPEERRAMAAVARGVIVEKFDRHDIWVAMRKRYIELLNGKLV